MFWDCIIELLISILGSSFTGIIIGASITYLFNLRVQRRHLVMNLQIEASKNMLLAINNYRDSIFRIHNSLTDAVFSIEQYISTYHELIGTNEWQRKENIETSTLQFFKKRTEGSFEDDITKWNEFIKAYNTYWTTFESNQVILNPFVGHYEEIYRAFKIFNDSRNKIIREYQMNVSSDLISNNQINKDSFNLIQEKKVVFDKSVADLIAFLGDFVTDLQNRNLSKLFKNYKIPKREPLNKENKVLTIEKRKIKIK